MTIAERLDEALLADTAPDMDTNDAWHIHDDDAAAWVSRKAQDAHRNIARINAWAEREKARIDAVAEAERAPYERDAEWAEGHLHVWLASLVREGRSKKSVELPGGTVKLRARPARLEIEDEGQAIAWLREHAPELVRTKESVDKTKFRKAIDKVGTAAALKETGEVVPWARLEPQEDSVSFVPTEGSDD